LYLKRELLGNPKEDEVKRLSVLAMVVVVVVTALVLFFLWSVPVHAQVVDQPACSITMTQQFNHVDFQVTWSGGSENGNYPFQFGDSSLPDVLTGASGSKILPHDYSWNVGGIATYTARVTVVGESEQCSCEQQVIIDDSPVVPPPSFVVYLPLVLAQSDPPVVEIYRQPNEVFNHVEVYLVWSGADEAWHRLEWGDGSSIDLPGASGNRKVDHWYAEGAWEIRFVVTGPGGTTARSLLVTIRP